VDSDDGCVDSVDMDRAETYGVFPTLKRPMGSRSEGLNQCNLGLKSGIAARRLRQN